MTDIVIDTCTLKHAEDPTNKYFEYSVDFIFKMTKNTLVCIVDEGFDLNETINKSYIGLEYITHLQPSSLGYQLIVSLILNNRLDFVSNKIPNAKKKYIEQIIINRKDRLFLRVAYNTTDKTLASHDFTDYQKKKRKTIKKELSITIETAEELNSKI